MRERLEQPLLALNMEGDYKPRNVSRQASRSWKMHKDGFSLRASRMEHTPDDTLILVQRDPFQTSDLQNYKVTHLCCFEP